MVLGILQAKILVDYRKVLAIGGNGGDGCISLLRVHSNEFAGPDGGDGGSGGHVVFHVRDFLLKFIIANF